MDRLTAIATLILDEAKKQGADAAQCRVSESEKKEFNVDGGRFSLMRTLFDRSVSVTVLRDKRKGSVRINRFDDDAVKAAVGDCLAACESAQPDDAWEFCAEACDEHFTDGAPECDTEALFMRTKELLKDVSARHPKIMLEQVICDHNGVKCVYMNSYGVKYTTHGGSYNISLMYSAHEGEKGTSFYGTEVSLKTLDKPLIDCALIEREFTQIEAQLGAGPLEGKFTGTVLLAPMASLEIVVGTVLSNFVSDLSLIDATSIWKDKLNAQVADERFTLAITPHAPYVVSGSEYTGEGYPAKDFELIENGVLKSFQLSQYGANKTKGVRAGSDSWEISITPGEKTLDEMIKGIEKGVLVMRFSGGQPSAGGEFSGVAKNSFLIENGRLAGALTETMISGSVPEMLTHIRDIGSEVLCNGSMSVPYISFDGVTISGK